MIIGPGLEVLLQKNKPASHANKGSCQWHHWLEGLGRAFLSRVTKELRLMRRKNQVPCCWQREWPVQRPYCGNKLNDGAWGQSWPVRTEEGWVTWGLLGVWILQCEDLLGCLGELVGWLPQVQCSACYIHICSWGVPASPQCTPCLLQPQCQDSLKILKIYFINYVF